MKNSKILSFTSFLGCLLLSIGITASPALQSIGVALIFAGGFPLIVTAKPRLNLFALLLILYYVIHLLAFFNTADKDRYYRDIRMALPFFLIPIGLYTNKVLAFKSKIYVLLVFISTVFLVGSFTFWYYITHLSYYNARLIQSKPIDIISFKEFFMALSGKVLPTDAGGNIIGLDHIYFSFMLAFVVWATIYVIHNQYFTRNWQKFILVLMSVAMIIYLHTIAARTGLVAFYAAGLFVILYIIFIKKKVALGILFLAAVAAIGVLSVLYIPALHNRFLNTKEDIGSYNNQNTIKNYSISPRVEALQASYNIFKKSPIFGVSRAGIDTAMKKQYIAQNSPLAVDNPILPHNQFVFELVASGLVGFLALAAIFIYPVCVKKTRLNPLFMFFLVICFFSFQAEYGLERQAGISFFVLFYMLLSEWRVVSGEKWK